MRTNDHADDQLPRHIRPLAFAGAELALDICNTIRTIYDVDIENALILLCVSDATMRALFGARGDAEITRAVHPSLSERGSISRLVIADKIGLPRQTVRRKITELIKLGFLEIDNNDIWLRTDAARVGSAPSVSRHDGRRSRADDCCCRPDQWRRHRSRRQSSPD